MVPVLILVVIAIPSFRLHVLQGPASDTPTMTLKVTGHQWYWTYEYPDQGGIDFDSNMLSDADRREGRQARLLAVDNPLVVPVGTDDPHPGHRHRRDPQLVRAVDRRAGIRDRSAASTRPGCSVDRPGTYYGQCNQICGINHPFMPIEIQAVSEDDFANGSATRQEEVRARTTASAARLAAGAAQ